MSSQAAGQLDVTADESAIKSESMVKDRDSSMAPDTEMIDVGGEASDGEIMDGDENKDVVVMNKMQQVAAEALRSRQKH